MSCKHEPDSPIAAFCFTCKHCGFDIESISCFWCDGMGDFINTDGSGNANFEKCKSCNGTGVESWKLMEVGI